MGSGRPLARPWTVAVEPPWRPGYAARVNVSTADFRTVMGEFATGSRW
jgi:hypothetical protein